MDNHTIEILKEEFYSSKDAILNLCLEALPADIPDYVVDHVKRLFNYTVLGGKMLRGLLCYITARALNPNSHKDTAIRASWAIELLQASFLVADDIMDNSIVRRGKPSWFTQTDKSSAYNDAFLLSELAYNLVRNDSHLLLLLHSTSFKTVLGQNIDTLFKPRNPLLIQKYKTSFYTFNYSICAGYMIATGHIDNSLEVLSENLGYLFQIQDDYFDIFPPHKWDKDSHDLFEGKFTWPLFAVWDELTPEARQYIDDNLGTPGISYDVVRTYLTEADIKAKYESTLDEYKHKITYHQCDDHLHRVIEWLLSVLMTRQR